MLPLKKYLLTLTLLLSNRNVRGTATSSGKKIKQLTLELSDIVGTYIFVYFIFPVLHSLRVFGVFVISCFVGFINMIFQIWYTNVLSSEMLLKQLKALWGLILT